LHFVVQVPEQVKVFSSSLHLIVFSLMKTLSQDKRADTLEVLEESS
jgi:hypothetical protein